MSVDITLRPALPQDRAFLFQVYAGTREAELAQTGWTAEQRQAFLEMQFTAQQTDYTARFPDAEHTIILVDGNPVGRIWVGRWEDEIRLLDIALLPWRRNAGTGTVLLKRLQREAEEAGKPLRHSVYKMNEAALRFYERLGFTVIEDFETYVLMEWLPHPPGG
jgi:ribosomal protein S18 acetylase RimI-like enzyme